MHPVLMGALGLFAIAGGVAIAVRLREKPKLDPPRRGVAEEGFPRQLMAALAVGTILFPPAGLIAAAWGLADVNKTKRSQGLTLGVLAVGAVFAYWLTLGILMN